MTEYARSNFDAPRRYASAGFLSIDYNLSEQPHMFAAIDRNDWIFAGSEHRVRTALILLSLTANRNHFGIDTFAYLLELLMAFPSISDPDPNSSTTDSWTPKNYATPDRITTERSMTGVADV